MKQKSSKPKLPKWTPQRTLEDSSVDFVREVFRGWRVASQQATDVGIDLRFEIVDLDGSTTGAEISCQVKATKKLRVTSDGVAQRLKISTANYFLVRPELVLLIVYDAQRRQAYWSWIQEYLRQNWSGGWEQHETITVKLPIGNLLTSETRSIIEKRVRWHHERQKILTATQTTNDPHYEYQVTTSNHEITVGVVPKYPGAEQDKPLRISGQFKFDIKTPEGAEAFSKFERMLKTGEDFKVDSRFIEKFHLPEIFSKIFALPNDSQPASISITSIPDKEIRPVRYTFESSDGRFRSEFPYVEYRVIRAGTQETLLSNERQSILAKFQVLLSRNERIQFKFEANIEGRSAKEVLNFLHLQAVFAVGGATLVEFLKTGARYKDTVPPSSTSMPEDWVMKIAEDLAFIERMLQISVTWPKVVRSDDAARIRPIAQILRTGTATGFIDQHVALRSSSKQFKWLTENYEPGSVTKYRVAMPAYHVDVFGTEIDLGPVEITIPTGRFTEESEALILSKRPIADDESVALEFKSGVEPAGYRFMRWLPMDSDESNSKT